MCISNMEETVSLYGRPGICQFLCLSAVKHNFLNHAQMCAHVGKLVFKQKACYLIKELFRQSRDGYY